MRLAPAMPMTTKLIWLEIWPIWAVNCLVMLRKGMATAMVSGRPEMLRLGMPKPMHAGRDRHEDVEQVADVHEDGHEGVRVAVGRARRRLELVVDLVEIGDRLVLVAEDLDDLLAAHDLLDVALERRDRTLLAQEVLGRAASEEARRGGHEHRTAQDHAGHRNAVNSMMQVTETIISEVKTRLGRLWLIIMRMASMSLV